MTACLIEQAKDRAADELNHIAAELPMLNSKQRELLMHVMAAMWLAGRADAFLTARNLLPRVSVS